MDQIKIGRFIQSLRKDKDLTQAELANRLGYCTQIKTGKHHIVMERLPCILI